MERGDAAAGIELYKESSALSERLNAYYGSMQALPPLRAFSSTTTTGAPARAACKAACKPETPAPMTSTSQKS